MFTEEERRQRKRARSRNYYLYHREAAKKLLQRNRAHNLEWGNGIKLAHGCALCGYKTCPDALECII
jgi:hypothetical protein